MLETHVTRPPSVVQREAILRRVAVLSQELGEDRTPLPLFSASLPSGLRMRTPKSGALPVNTTRIPSDPTPRLRSQMSRTAIRRQLERKVLRVP
jgi:hypothetical protein